MLIYTAVTILLLCGSQKANNTAERAIHDTNENFSKDQRPYVWIENGKTGMPTELKLADKPGFAQIIWTVNLYNFGKMPAYRFSGTRHIQVGNHDRTLSYMENVSIPTLIPPTGDVLTTTISTPDIRQSDVNATLARGSQLRITIWGDYTYFDSAGATTYETHYCLSRLNSGSIAFCEGGDIK